MHINTDLLKPRYGYSLEKPDSGKTLFHIALTIAIACPLVFLIARVILGADGMQAWWDAGKLNGFDSPAAVTGLVKTLFGIGCIIWHSIIVKGWRRSVACISIAFFIAWFYEFLGTNCVSGGVFGPYHYNADTLGQHILGVPFGVALGWELFAYPAFYLALYLMPSEHLGEDKSLFNRVCSVLVISTLGGLFCVVTDFLSDPLAVDHGFFTWHVNGGVYQWLSGSGEPLSNFTGWWICGFTMMLSFCFILQTTPSKRHYRSKYLDIYFPLALYGAHFTDLFSQELLFQQRQDVTLFGLFGFGGVLLILLVKLYLEKQGAQPHPLGKAISHEALQEVCANLNNKGRE